MIRAVVIQDKQRKVLLGLQPENVDRLREGQPIVVNPRYIDPSGDPRPELPDIELVIFFAGQTEIEALQRAWKEQGHDA